MAGWQLVQQAASPNAVKAMKGALTTMTNVKQRWYSMTCLIKPGFLAAAGSASGGNDGGAASAATAGTTLGDDQVGLSDAV